MRRCRHCCRHAHPGPPRETFNPVTSDLWAATRGYSCNPPVATRINVASLHRHYIATTSGDRQCRVYVTTVMSLSGFVLDRTSPLTRAVITRHFCCVRPSLPVHCVTAATRNLFARHAARAVCAWRHKARYSHVSVSRTSGARSNVSATNCGCEEG